jgi:hypothetical protein
VRYVSWGRAPNTKTPAAPWRWAGRTMSEYLRQGAVQASDRKAGGSGGGDVVFCLAYGQYSRRLPACQWFHLGQAGLRGTPPSNLRWRLCCRHSRQRASQLGLERLMECDGAPGVQRSRASAWRETSLLLMEAAFRQSPLALCLLGPVAWAAPRQVHADQHQVEQIHTAIAVHVGPLIARRAAEIGGHQDQVE